MLTLLMLLMFMFEDCGEGHFRSLFLHKSFLKQWSVTNSPLTFSCAECGPLCGRPGDHRGPVWKRTYYSTVWALHICLNCLVKCIYFFIKLSESSAPRAEEDQAALWDVKGRRREAPGQTRTVSISTAETNVWPVWRPVVLVCAVMLMSPFSRFLYELFRIPDFEGRAHCMIFQSVFNDTIASVHRKLDTVSSVCKVRRKNKQTPEI